MNGVYIHLRTPNNGVENKCYFYNIHKNNILRFGWMQDMGKWFGICDSTHLLQNALIDCFVNEGGFFATWKEFENVQ